ncbi:MAG: hypothetical protein PF692_02745 [Kiritimatiellae bacterium]|jgi:hypothetical protein|nr:hypothetical protein [Kiritimatiellia bacterium]
MKTLKTTGILLVLALTAITFTSCGGGGGDDPEPTGVIYSNNFDQNSVGTYTVGMLNADWNSPSWSDGIAEGRVSIISGGDAYSGNSMQILYPQGQIGNTSGALWEMKLNGSYNELYCSYKVKFGENLNFDFSKGGKLPGLGGGTTPTGGGKPTGYDGWTARIMWREVGELFQYVYYPDQAGIYGDYMGWEVLATPGVWHDMKVRIVMNSPGVSNGILEAWFDGFLVLSRNNIMYRKTDAFAIDTLVFNTFYGGGDSSWAPFKNEYIYFDNFRIYQ